MASVSIWTLTRPKCQGSIVVYVCSLTYRHILHGKIENGEWHVHQMYIIRCAYHSFGVYDTKWGTLLATSLPPQLIFIRPLILFLPHSRSFVSFRYPCSVPYSKLINVWFRTKCVFLFDDYFYQFYHQNALTRSHLASFRLSSTTNIHNT